MYRYAAKEQFSNYPSFSLLPLPLAFYVCPGTIVTPGHSYRIVPTTTLPMTITIQGSMKRALSPNWRNSILAWPQVNTYLQPSILQSQAWPWESRVCFFYCLFSFFMEKMSFVLLNNHLSSSGEAQYGTRGSYMPLLGDFSFAWR